MKNINITVREESPFYYGMKVFVVKAAPRNQSKFFTDKCPVCGDSRRVEIKGYNLPCPMCNSSSRSRSDAIAIELINFSVIEFIINEVIIKGDYYKKDYALSSTKLPRAEWIGFSRWGNGYSDMETRKFITYDFADKNVEAVDLKSSINSYCFYSKADANKFCKRLHERQKEMLDKFNAEHGTNYEYPFDN